MANQFTYLTATIANGVALAGAVELGGSALVGIQMPAAWTAANLTAQISVDGTTYQDMYDDEGNEVTITAAASRFIQLIPSEWAGVHYIKLRSGTTGTPVNQGAARTLTLVVREV